MYFLQAYKITIKLLSYAYIFYCAWVLKCREKGVCVSKLNIKIKLRGTKCGIKYEYNIYIIYKNLKWVREHILYKYKI